MVSPIVMAIVLTLILISAIFALVRAGARRKRQVSELLEKLRDLKNSKMPVEIKCQCVGGDGTFSAEVTIVGAALSGRAPNEVNAGCDVLVVLPDGASDVHFPYSRDRGVWDLTFVPEGQVKPTQWSFSDLAIARGLETALEAPSGSLNLAVLELEPKIL